MESVYDALNQDACGCRFLCSGTKQRKITWMIYVFCDICSFLTWSWMGFPQAACGCCPDLRASSHARRRSAPLTGMTGSAGWPVGGPVSPCRGGCFDMDFGCSSPGPCSPSVHLRGEDTSYNPSCYFLKLKSEKYIYVAINVQLSP